MASRVLKIVQPGRLGDILLCLPIAKWYLDHGKCDLVVWPVHYDYLYMMKKHAPYVDAFQAGGVTWKEMVQSARGDDWGETETLDLSCGFKG